MNALAERAGQAAQGAAVSVTPRRKIVATERLPLQNAELAARLVELAELLEAQGANPFRVRAYRNAEETIRQLKEPAHLILEYQGIGGLKRLPGIGFSLAKAIERLAFTGRLGLLDRLRGEHEPERLFTTVSGIGRKTAKRIREQLGIDTLEQLESAAYDHRLSRVPGMGEKRIRAVRESLAGRFRSLRTPPPSPPALPREEPPVAELLSVDEEYRHKRKHLPRIAPRRFNPTAEAWLPVLHTQRHDRHYTALYSNTARAHELGTTHDWVVIYRDDHAGEGQWTVVTGRFGPLRGKRIVRGREDECEEHYAQNPVQEELFSMTNLRPSNQRD